MNYINKHERVFRHLANIKDDLEIYVAFFVLHHRTIFVHGAMMQTEKAPYNRINEETWTVSLNNLIELMCAKKSEKKGLKCLSNQLLGLIKDEPLDEKKQEELEDLRIKGKRDRLLAEKRKSIEDSTSSGVTKHSTERSSEKETFSGKDKAKKRQKDDPFVVSRAKESTKINTSIKLNLNPSVSLDDSDPTTVIFRAQLPPKSSKSGPPERSSKRNREPDSVS